MKNSIYSDRVFAQLLRFSPPQPPAPRKRSLPSLPYLPTRRATTSSQRCPRTCPSRLPPALARTRSTTTIVRLFAPVLRVALLILTLPLAALKTLCPTTGVIDGQHAALAFDRVFNENPVKFAGYEFLDVTVWVECSSEEARHVSVLECPAATLGLRSSVFYNVSF
jgi:hypothetical protein